MSEKLIEGKWHTASEYAQRKIKLGAQLQNEMYKILEPIIYKILDRVKCLESKKDIS